ncbi:hypothetical protein BDR26DRAFT_875795 [Obelidium mucronatum]|nr:hypothetical protein BDR26DRAFT_875795 [Obelidium mucronatum]
MLTKLRVNLQMKSAEHAAAFVANPHLVFTSNIAAQALDWTVWPQFYVSSFVSFSGCNTSAIHAFVKTFRFLGLRNGVIKMRLVGTTSMGIAGVYAELPLQLPSNLAVLDEPSINCQSSPTKGSSSKGILYPRHQNESLQLPQPPEGIIRPTAVFAHQWVVENKNLKGQLVELQAEKTTAMDDAASLRLALRHLEDHVTSIELGAVSEIDGSECQQKSC